MRLVALPGECRRALRHGKARVLRPWASLVPGIAGLALLAAAFVPSSVSAGSTSAGAASARTASARTASARTASARTASARTASVRTASAGAASAVIGRYVSLGDSYTSGPLIPRQIGSPVGCMRSSHNYPSLVAAAIGASSYKDISCQGADTTNMTGSEQVPLGANLPEFSALTAATSLVTVQVGGNDINFISIVINCTTLSFTAPLGSPCRSHYSSGGTDRLARAVVRTAPKVAAVLRGIRKHARGTRACCWWDTRRSCRPAAMAAGLSSPSLTATCHTCAGSS
jgi:lysophospholipase L1-like esterase